MRASCANIRTIIKERKILKNEKNKLIKKKTNYFNFNMYICNDVIIKYFDTIIS